VTAAPLRLVLLGDGDSPHLLKWARALAQVPGLELWALSSRGFLPGFDACLPAARRLALGTAPASAGGNGAILKQLPRVARWLKQVDAQWLHAHYLTSHGTLAWLAQRLFGVRGRLVSSAWGSDILVTPQRHPLLRWATSRVLRASALATSDSQVMAGRMRALGAGEVMVFPFGLEALPPAAADKDDNLFFANRGLEPLYRPDRVLQQFAALAVGVDGVAGHPGRLVVAHDGSLRATLERQAADLGLAHRVSFVGRLGADVQSQWYSKARWYLSLPSSDSVAVSVLEAMAHGCVPILSDLPANRELVRDGDNGLIVPDAALLTAADLQRMKPRADDVAQTNRAWVQDHALFEPCVQAFVARLRELA
jgi:glycosyltransferase involved in cell wall biosynthesis